MRNRFLVLAALCVLACCSNRVLAQAGVSSLSSSALGSGINLDYEEIRVEELVNFHRHNIPLPGPDKRINLDTRWCRLPDGTAAFQIGLATHRDVVREFRRPLNLVLVIDKSGSMSGDRIEKVKRALHLLVAKLNPQDLVSLVTYSDQAEVCIESTHPSDVNEIRQAISAIKVGGSTNLSSGLMKGFHLADRQYDSGRSNRLILLTDGIANRGTTDKHLITKRAKRLINKGIGVSTIGLGNNFNRDLLRELADSGNGACHFIANSSDLKKVFVDEFDSLLSAAASNVAMTVEAFEGGELPKIFGYKPIVDGKCVSIDFEDMSYGATQVVVGRFRSSEPIMLKVKLAYNDVCLDKEVCVSQIIDVDEACTGESAKVVAKNYAIAKVSNSIRQAAKLAGSEQYRKASRKLKAATDYARTFFPVERDTDIDRVCDIANLHRRNYQHRIDVSHLDD